MRTMMKRSCAVVAAIAALGAGMGTVAATEATAAPVPATKVQQGPVQIHSGQSLTLHSPGRKDFGICTLTGVAADSAGKLYGVTSGHCLDPKVTKREITTIKDRAGHVIAGPEQMAQAHFELSGKASISARDGYQPHGLNDIAWFPLAPGVTGANFIDSQVTTGIKQLDDSIANISKVATPPRALGAAIDVSQLRSGQWVCKDGQTTGRTCGVVLKVNAKTKEISALIPSIPGDSGAPLYTMGKDGKAHIVGNLTGGSPLLFNLFDGTRQYTAEAGLTL